MLAGLASLIGFAWNNHANFVRQDESIAILKEQIRGLDMKTENRFTRSDGDKMDAKIHRIEEALARHKIGHYGK